MRIINALAALVAALALAWIAVHGVDVRHDVNTDKMFITVNHTGGTSNYNANY